MFFCLLVEKRMSAASNMKKNHRRAVAGTVLLLAVALLAACRGGGAADARLLAVDSVVDTDSVAAWRMLQAVDSASLTREADRALYALLHQQLRYKQYLPLDTTVLTYLRAYYSRLPHSRHSFQSFLLTGGAMEDAGDLKSAVAWYKRAESSLDTADYRHLAQINMRLAMIYYNHFADHHIVKQKFERVVYYDEKIGDNANLAVALDCLGGVYRTVSHSRAHATLRRASKLALSKGNYNTFVSSNEKLARCLLNDSLPRAAYEIVKNCENIAGDSMITDDCFYTASLSLSQLGDPNGAAGYLHKTRRPADTYSRMMNAMCRMRIAEARGEAALALRYSKEVDRCADSLKNASAISSILETEIEADSDTKASLLANNSAISRLVAVLLLVLTLVVLLAVIAYYYRDYVYRRRLRAMKHEVDTLAERLLEQNELTATAGATTVRESFASAFVANYISELRSLMEMNRKLSPLEFKKAFERLSRELSSNQRFWQSLRDYVESTYAGVVTRWERACPDLNESEIRLMSLMLAGFGYIEVATLLGYSAGSMSMHRKRIASKMGIRGSLLEYIHQVQNHQDRPSVGRQGGIKE